MTININSGQCALVQICNLSQQYNETVCSGKGTQLVSLMNRLGRNLISVLVVSSHFMHSYISSVAPLGCFCLVHG